MSLAAVVIIVLAANMMGEYHPFPLGRDSESITGQARNNGISSSFG
jgi:hypothetical protein